MIVLSVNAGSSSLKFQAFDMPEEKVLISGVFERIGIKDSFYTIKLNGEKIKKEADLKNHEVAFQILMEELIENKIPQKERLIRLNNSAKRQMKVLRDNKNIKELEELQREVNNFKMLN